MNYELLYNLEKEENLKLKRIIRELESDIDMYKIRLKNTKELSAKAPEKEQSITTKQLNIYC